MKYIGLADDKTHKLPFYLAMEEYVAKHLDLDEAFFMWQVEPTVIFGRNQLIEKEVNLPYCKSKGIATYRRKSGGGCVYADKGNIMFSYITSTYNVANAYACYLGKVVDALNSLGVPAEATGRNDITAGGKKISGNAFYHVEGKSIVHGTMLYDTDMDNMINAITPSTVKLTSKGVDSVKGRITVLKNFLDISIDDFKDAVREKLCDETLVLGSGAEAEIISMERMYLSDEFIFGNNPYCNIDKEEHIDGVGNFKVLIEVKKGVIRRINLMGDFFIRGDMDARLLNRLIGMPYNENSVRKALEDVSVGEIILNMTNDQLIKLILI